MKLKYTGKKLHLMIKDGKGEILSEVAIIDYYIRDCRIDIIARAVQRMIQELKCLNYTSIDRVDSSESSYEDIQEISDEYSKKSYLECGYIEVND